MDTRQIIFQQFWKVKTDLNKTKQKNEMWATSWLDNLLQVLDSIGQGIDRGVLVYYVPAECVDLNAWTVGKM